MNTLTKTSTSDHIRSFFEALLHLKNTGREFPVNFDDVWPLIYDRRDNAIRELKENYMELVDYQIFLKNEEKSKRGRPLENYTLSLSCMEYFIARKVRSVFEVYRQVFHKTVEKVIDKSEDERILDAMKLLVERVEDQKLLIAQKSEELEKANETIIQQAPKVEYADKVLSSVGGKHATAIAAEFGMSAIKMNKKLKEMGIIRNMDTHYVLTAKYLNKGYEEYRTIPYLNSNGEQCSAKEMLWTEKGRQFLHTIFGTYKLSQPFNHKTNNTTSWQKQNHV